MGIFSKLFGKEKSETVLEIENKIAELDKEEAAARRAIIQIDARHDALLISGDDDDLDSDGIAKIKANRTLERAALARAHLSERLISARENARQALIAELSRERDDIVARLSAAMAAAIEINEEAQRFHEKVIASLGQSEVALSEPFAYPLLQRSMLEPWQAYIEQMNGQTYRPATPGTSSLPSPSVPPMKTTNPAKDAPGGPLRTKRRARKPLPDTVPAGHLRCVALRDGYEAPNGEGLSVGDQVDLPMDIAKLAAANGAVEFAGVE